MEEPKNITISVLKGDMGSGKTEAVINQIKNNPSELILFMSPSHSSLYEMGDRLTKAGIDFVHWEGFTRLCPEYQSDNQDIIDLYRFLRVRQICTFCNNQEFINPNSCPYRTQFNTRNVNVIIAPLAFINTSVIKNRNWNQIFVDDVDIISRKPLPSLTEIIKDWDFCMFFMYDQEFLDQEPKFDELPPRQILRNIRKMNDWSRNYYRVILENGENPADWKMAPLLLNPNTSAFFYWQLILQKYGKREHIAYLNLFHLFRLAESPQIKVTIVGKQTPTRLKCLQLVADRYTKENEKKIVFTEIEPLKWEKAPKRAPLLRICLDGRYPKVSLLENKSTRKRVAKEIVLAIKKLIREDKIQFKSFGVISTLALWNKGEEWLMKEFFSNKIYSEKPQILTFGNLRSSNKFEKVDVVVILGTYITNHKALVEEHNQVFIEKELDPEKVTSVKNEFKGYIFNKHENLEILRQHKEEDEMTQAIGRGSPRGVPTIVIGIVPDYLKKDYADVYQDLRFNPMKEMIEEWEALLDKYFEQQGICELKASECRRILEQTGYKFTKNAPRFHRFLEDNFQKYKLVKDSKGKRGPPCYYLVKR